MTSGTPGYGYLYQLVVSAIRNGQRTERQIAPTLKSHCGGIALKNLLRKMNERGFIIRNRYGWTVTNKGLEYLPNKGYTNTTVYKPPQAPPRRPGSSIEHIPSVYADIRVPYRPHV